jgi:hypothetical protein
LYLNYIKKLTREKCGGNIKTRTLLNKEDESVFDAVTSLGEAQENLRLIRQTMERSTKYSTLSGLSGVVAGAIALIGAFLQDEMPGSGSRIEDRFAFLFGWAVVVGLALVADYFLTKRRAALVGKSAFSPLGKQMARAVLPGLLAGVIIALFYLAHPRLMDTHLYGFWMLCYAASVLAAGMFSVKEVSYLGWAFFVIGAVTLLMPPEITVGPRAMMALSFGGFHVAYGIGMGIKHGW